jgi:hypothetical protein
MVSVACWLCANPPPVARGSRLWLANCCFAHVGLGVITAITAQISAQITRRFGVKIGEIVRDRQQVELGAGPNSAIVHQIIWKRRVISAERHYLSHGNPVRVPYRIIYGLSLEQKALKHAANR